MAIADFENDRFRRWSSHDDLLLRHVDMQTSRAMTALSNAAGDMNLWYPVILWEGNPAAGYPLYGGVPTILRAFNVSPLPTEIYFIPNGVDGNLEDGAVLATHQNTVVLDEIPRSIEAIEMRLSIRARVASQDDGATRNGRRAFELGIFDVRDVATPAVAEVAVGGLRAAGARLLGITPFEPANASDDAPPVAYDTLRFDQVVALRRNTALGLYVRCVVSLDGGAPAVQENNNRGVFFQLEHLMLRRD